MTEVGLYIVDYDPDIFKELGVKSLIFPSSVPREIVEDAEREFEVFIDFKPFEGGTIENIFNVKNRLGPLGCPSDIDLWSRNLEKVGYDREMLILDFVRYPSPAYKDDFYTCFCDKCREMASMIGYNLDDIKSDVKLYLRNGDTKFLDEWFRLKRDVINEYLKWASIKRAFYFTPSLSRLVGQDYRLHRLDVIHPMIYIEDIGPAAIGTEVKYLSGGLRRLILSWLDPIDNTLIGREYRKAVDLSKARVEPIINIGDDLQSKLSQVMDAGKIYLFTYTRRNYGILKKVIGVLGDGDVEDPMV